MAKLTKAAKPEKPLPAVFLGRCQHCLDNAYLNSDCSWKRHADCLIARARRAALQDGQAE